MRLVRELLFRARGISRGFYFRRPRGIGPAVKPLKSRHPVMDFQRRRSSFPALEYPDGSRFVFGWAGSLCFNSLSIFEDYFYCHHFCINKDVKQNAVPRLFIFTHVLVFATSILFFFFFFNKKYFHTRLCIYYFVILHLYEVHFRWEMGCHWYVKCVFLYNAVVLFSGFHSNWGLNWGGRRGRGRGHELDRK